MRRGYVYGVGCVGLCDAWRKWTLIAIVLETRLRLTHRGGGVRSQRDISQDTTDPGPRSNRETME
jgi:hypothetical protein